MTSQTSSLVALLPCSRTPMRTWPQVPLTGRSPADAESARVTTKQHLHRVEEVHHVLVVAGVDLVHELADRAQAVRERLEGCPHGGVDRVEPGTALEVAQAIPGHDLLALGDQRRSLPLIEGLG